MTPQERLVEIAVGFIGTKEEGGENCGAQVEAFQRAVDGKAQGEPWCLAFAQYCIDEVVREEGVARAIYDTEHCGTAWAKTPHEQRVSVPEPGCLIFWDFGGGKGHVGIVEAVVGERIHTIEGNTGDGQGVVREGDGVYRRDRSRLGSPKMRVLGFIRPFSE